jgi:hypothetical protein
MIPVSHTPGNCATINMRPGTPGGSQQVAGRDGQARNLALRLSKDRMEGVRATHSVDPL